MPTCGDRPGSPQGHQVPDECLWIHRAWRSRRHSLVVERLVAGCYKRRVLLATARSMKLVSIPANPVPDNFVTDYLKTPDGVSPALCALAASGGPPRHRVHLSGPRRMDRKIFRDRARFARARICGGDARLARPGSLRADAERSPQRICARLLRLRHRSRNLHARDRAAGLPAAAVCHRSFDRRDRSDPRRVTAATAGSIAWC